MTCVSIKLRDAVEVNLTAIMYIRLVYGDVEFNQTTMMLIWLDEKMMKSIVQQ